MSEQKSEEKVVSRTIAIILAVICFLLVVGLAVVAALFSSYSSNHTHTNTDYNSLQAEVTDLTNTVNLAKSTVWTSSQTVSQTAGNYTSWYFQPSYAGYVLVNVTSSTTSNTYAEAIQSTHGSHPVVYDDSITVGTGGIAVFPTLPGSIQVRVGNTNLSDGATETVTITYYY
jgi:hypothetical protein